MKIDLLSFFFGVILTLAVVIVVEQFYGVIWGNRKLRQLKKEVMRLRGVLRKKDELIKKSLKSIQEMEKRDEQETRTN